MAGMELINLSMWLLMFQHRDMHPKAVGFIAVDVVDFSPHARSAGGWVGAMALGELHGQASPPSS